MTLITRLRGNRRTIVACDGQINNIEGHPIRTGEQKLFIIKESISIGIAGILSIDDFVLIDFLKKKLESEYDDSESVSEFLVAALNSIDNEKFTSQRSYVFLSYIKDSSLIHEVILNEGGTYSLRPLDISKDILHQTISNNFNRKYSIKLSDDRIMNTDIHSFIDINHDYNEVKHHGVNDTSLIYTILTLVFKKYGYELNKSLIDEIPLEDVEKILNCFYDLMDSTKIDRSIVPEESALLRTIGKLKTIIVIDNTGLKYIKE